MSKDFDQLAFSNIWCTEHPRECSTKTKRKKLLS